MLHVKREEAPWDCRTFTAVLKSSPDSPGLWWGLSYASNLSHWHAVSPQQWSSTPSRPCLNRQLVTAGVGSAEHAGGQGCSECRCLSLNVQSCKSEDLDWRELKAWYSLPINSTVYCQSNPDWQSSTHQFKWAFLVIEERSVGWIPIRAGSILSRQHLEKAVEDQAPFGE